MNLEIKTNVVLKSFILNIYDIFLYIFISYDKNNLDLFHSLYRKKRIIKIKITDINA